MPKKSVRYQKQLAAGSVSQKETFPLEQAISKIQDMAKVGVNRTYKNGRKRGNFDQTVELAIHLGIDPKQADQALRGSLSLPKGIGKTKKVIAFCDGEMADKAKAAGAIEASVEELVKKITDGWLDFDVAVAHPSVMGKVGKLGRTLGPTGKMPSPKSGTVTQDVETAVKEFAAGKVEYRNDDGGNLHVPVGKASFSSDDIKENVEAFLSHVNRIKPAATKGQYIKRVSLSATMTPGVTVAMQ
jgi:large subunit ribosomal protein L1